MLVADDVLGGFFAINGGGLPGNPGDMVYLPPDTLQWEPMAMGHSTFVDWTLTGRLDELYLSHRWDGWERELWAEGPAIGERTREPVPIEEIWRLWQDFAAKGV